MLGTRMRYLITGGSRFDPAVGRQFEAMGFTLLQAYGMTETSGGACVTPPNDIVMGSIGKPLPGNEMKIFDGVPSPEHGGASVGEVAFRGGIIMAGYYKRPDATAAMYRDGWLCTGDLGYCDADGNFYITGRKKDVIVLSNGKNIYPEEIEAHYLQSPNIKEVCVLGLQSAPGEPFSERLHAVIVPDFEALRRAKIVNVGDMLRFEIEGLSAKVPSTKRILSYEIWQRRPAPHHAPARSSASKSSSASSAAKARRPRPAAPRELTPEEAEWMQQPNVSKALGDHSGRLQAEERHAASRPTTSNSISASTPWSASNCSSHSISRWAPACPTPSPPRSTPCATWSMPSSPTPAATSQRSAAGWEEVIHEDPGEDRARHHRPRSPHHRARCVLSCCASSQLMFRDLFQAPSRRRRQASADRARSFSRPITRAFSTARWSSPACPGTIMRDTFYVGTSEIFGSKLMRRIAEFVRLIPIDPDANLVPAMRAGAYGLRQKRVLVLFPEGERSIDGPPKTLQERRGHPRDSHPMSRRAGRLGRFLRGLAARRKIPRLLQAEGALPRSRLPAALGPNPEAAIRGDDRRNPPPRRRRLRRPAQSQR